MHRILLIDQSATLRLVLTKLLSKNSYLVEATTDFESGLKKLLTDKSPDGAFAAVLLGWPIQTDPGADEFLSLLTESGYATRPAVIMAQEAEPAMRKWVANRPRSALVLWENYVEALGTLTKLLAPTPVSITPQPAVGTEEIPIRALFVDDSPTVRVSYRRLLSGQGYMVETAASADEAFEKARRQPFDIAIIDYFMPDSNGDELARRLRDDPETASITTALLTGTYLDEVIKDALDAGAVECMFKNEAKELFLARISAISRTIRVQKSIEAERQRLAGILSSVGDGVYGVNKRGLITFINPAGRRILGYRPMDQLIGKSPHTLFHFALDDGTPNPPEACFLQQTYGAGEALYSWETVFWHRNGKAIPVECTVYPLRIANKLEGSVVAFRDISERKRLEAKLRWMATHDPLTEMYNRHYFEEQLEQEVLRLKRGRETSALVYIDLDRFKYINDTAGHTAGDQLLINVARLLRSRVRDTDTLARLGGDEFALIMRNIRAESVREAAEAVRDVLRNWIFDHGGKSYKISSSAGVAIIDKNSQSPGEVLANADIACYIAKTEGRNQTHIYVPDNDEKISMDHDLGWSTRLADALQNDHFVLYYQPIVSIDDLDIDNLPDEDGHLWNHTSLGKTGEICYEVLVRLAEPDGKIISPNAFLPTAERFDLMRDIDHWVLTKALSILGQQKDRNITFAINLSGQTLGDKRLLPLIKSLLNEHNVDPASLIFEITETAAISNIDAASRAIATLNGIGCRFALDDFGSGFSSFYHLKHLPVEYIKIDGSFVQGIAKDSIDHAMVTSMNDVAHSLGRLTIAEYVESAEIARLLKRCGVDYLQGYYICEPLPELWTADKSTVSASQPTCQ